MAKASQMQGVSAYLTTLKSDGKRRHPSHCIHAEGKGKERKCTCPQCVMYNEHCRSSVHCDYYEETER